jgi:hypothetical protein
LGASYIKGVRVRVRVRVRVKPVVVGEEVQHFDFPLPHHAKHNPVDVILLANVDEEEGKEHLTYVSSEFFDVFKDAWNIAEINRKYAKFFAETMKKMRK